MNGFFLGILEITVGMSFLILVMLFGLKLIGGKFTAKCRYILWTLVMIRLAIPFSFGILPALIEVPVETEPTPVQVQIQVPTVEYTPVPQNPVTIPPQEQVQIPNPPVQTPVFTEPEPEPITWNDVKVYIPHVYLTGAAVFLLWNLLSYQMYTAKILRTAKEADTGTQQIYEAVCRKKGLSRLPVLLVSSDVNSPAAFGLLRRRIVLPEIDFTENGLAGTLSHEVTHCIRGDLWIKVVCLLARAFHWCNPLVHLAAFRCEMEMELSCDESVLAGCDENTRAAYGEVMLDIIKRCRRNRGALTTHFNPGKNAVKARFTNILYGSGKKRGLWLIAVCLVLCLVSGAIVACRTEVPEEATETAEEAQQRETLLATYELYQTEFSDLQVQLELLDDKHADLTASRAELQKELQSLTASREDLYTQLAGMPEDSEETLHLRLAIQVYDEDIKSHQLAITGVDAEIALLKSQRQTVQEKLQALADSINDTEAKMQEMDILQENDIAAEDTTKAVTVTSPIYLCDDVYRSETTPTHGESTILFPTGLNGYKLYTCEVLLCTDGCSPQDVVWRKFFGYAGGFPLNELALTDTGKYSTRLYKVTYPEEELAQILDNMELQGASEQHKQEYRNKRWYLYLLTVDEDHYACIFLEPEDVLVVPENEQEILDALVASVEIDITRIPEENWTQYTESHTVSVQEFNVSFNCPEKWQIERSGILYDESGKRIGERVFREDYSFEEYEQEVFMPSSHSVLKNPDSPYQGSTQNGMAYIGYHKRVESSIDYSGADVYTFLIQYSDSVFMHISVWQQDTDAYEDFLHSVALPIVESVAIEQMQSDDLAPPVSTADPDTIWQVFLDTVVAPYKENISSQEFLDLDGNGIEELLLFDLGNGICEIYTIEGGDVRCLYTGQQGSGHSLLTIYHDNPTMLAPPSLGAGEYVFYASRTPEDVSKTRYKNWFVPSPSTGGYVLYSTYGNTVSRTDQYFHFYSGEDAVLGKVLCVAELSRFEREAINSNPALGWECRHQGEKVSKNQYMTAVQECWDILEQRYGVTYTEEETLHRFDELRKTPDTSFELLADLLDTLKTENPQAYMSRTPYGEEDSDVLHQAWGFSGAADCARSLAVNYTFEPLTAMEVQETTRITLHSPTEGEWEIHGWMNSKYIELITGGRSYFFRAAHKTNSEIYFGTTLQNWFDDAEYAAVPYEAVIPDTGQGFLSAAQTFVESWYGRNLQVSPGSENAFSYVSCSVRDAQNRDHLIENGWIAENTYTYYITVVFVPENTKAEMYHMAGNTGPYSGEDPAVPAGAYEFQRCGYITLEEDGWHGEVGGTGW